MVFVMSLCGTNYRSWAYAVVKRELDKLQGRGTTAGPSILPLSSIVDDDVLEPKPSSRADDAATAAVVEIETAERDAAAVAGGGSDGSGDGSEREAGEGSPDAPAGSRSVGVASASAADAGDDVIVVGASAAAPQPVDVARELASVTYVPLFGERHFHPCFVLTRDLGCRRVSWLGAGKSVRS